MGSDCYWIDSYALAVYTYTQLSTTLSFFLSPTIVCPERGRGGGGMINVNKTNSVVLSLILYYYTCSHVRVIECVMDIKTLFIVKFL